MWCTLMHSNMRTSVVNALLRFFFKCVLFEGCLLSIFGSSLHWQDFVPINESIFSLVVYYSLQISPAEHHTTCLLCPGYKWQKPQATSAVHPAETISSPQGQPDSATWYTHHNTTMLYLTSINDLIMSF